MRTVPNIIVAVLVFASLAATAANPDVHPVPITPNTNCTACHKDKAEGKVVHPAVQMGCTNTCHAVVNRNNVSYVETLRGGAPTLCFACHAGKKPAGHNAAHPIAFQVPPPPGALGPGTASCTACHDPHVARFDHLLKKAESGDKGQNLCLDCHTKGLNVPKDGSRHAALDMGCNTCHVLHKQGNPDSEEFIFHLAKQVPNLCTDCHDPTDSELKTAHHNLPFATAVCTDCHDPHSSARPALAQKIVHPPYAAGDCDSCHHNPAGQTLTFNKGGGSALCLGCHQDVQKQIDTAAVQHPALAETSSCTDCHNPHASRNADLITPDPVHACTSCHEAQKIVETTALVTHPPVFDIHKGCIVCHAPHGADKPNLLRQSVQQTCAMCHAELASKGKPQGHTIVPGTKITISRQYLGTIEKVSMHQAHTEGLPDPRNPKQTITCLTCHVPHGGGQGLLITGGKNTTTLCVQCHTIKDL